MVSQLGSHPKWATGTLAAPLSPRCCDISNLCLAVVESKVMLNSWSRSLLAHLSFLLLPDLVRWQHLSHLSLPTAVGGKPVLPPAVGTLMPCFATLSGDGRKALGRTGETRAKCLGAPARLRLHPSLELEFGVVLTLAGSSAPTSQIFLISLVWLIVPLLAFTPLSGWRDRLQGGDRWAPLCRAVVASLLLGVCSYL